MKSTKLKLRAVSGFGDSIVQTSLQRSPISKPNLVPSLSPVDAATAAMILMILYVVARSRYSEVYSLDFIPKK